MVTLSYLVEGQTEQAFIKKVLNPHLMNTFNIETREAQSTRGYVKLNVLIDMINQLLRREAYNSGYVTMLFDYYGPQWQHPDINSIDEVDTYLLSKVCCPERFIPYVQQYEVESLWFSNVDVISSCVSANPKQLRALEQITRDHHDCPETINGGSMTHPSMRLESVFEKRYNKVVHGEQIARKIGIPTMKAKCPRFRQWVTQLEHLGQP
jgi:Domain of unknown function (DUF4276)